MRTAEGASDVSCLSSLQKALRHLFIETSGDKVPTWEFSSTIEAIEHLTTDGPKTLDLEDWVRPVVTAVGMQDPATPPPLP